MGSAGLERSENGLHVNVIRKNAKMSKPVRTRIAPSPTGLMHIGTARTALFAWLYAKHCNGEFLVRIEDTDAARSSDEATQVIIDGLNWLGLAPDDSTYHKQSEFIERHKQAVQKLIDAEKVVYSFRDWDKSAEGEAVDYNLIPTENDFAEKYANFAEKYGPPAIRLHIASIIEESTLTYEDAVQGPITVDLTEEAYGDFVIQRADGTPTYNLAVVVDDAAMGITHVIRGDDHISNTPKQILLYKALGLDVPTFAHVSLIHGPDGKKLSKRHGAVGIGEFRAQGYLPTALVNYLMRLGWALGDEEIIPLDEAIKAFDIKDINKGASQLDFKKLDWVNAHYMQKTENDVLIKHLEPFFKTRGLEVNERSQKWLEAGLDELKQRAKRLDELAEAAAFYLSTPPFALDEKARTILLESGTSKLTDLQTQLASETWSHDALQTALNTYCESNGLKFKDIGMPLRIALMGKPGGPSVTHVMEILGKEETLSRISLTLEHAPG